MFFSSPAGTGMLYLSARALSHFDLLSPRRIYVPLTSVGLHYNVELLGQPPSI